MSDRTPDCRVAVWIALRRAHQGGVAKLGSCWLDSGHPVPDYVADALDELTSAGLLALADADPQSCGMRRVTVTDTGSARYLALCQIHNPRGRAVVSTPRRWAGPSYDQRSHLLTECGPDQIGVLIGVCGHRMSWSVPTSTQPTGPRCPTCQALASLPLPAPRLGTSPDSDRPSAEQRRPPLLAPGGRPDTTTPGDQYHGPPGTGQVMVNPGVQLLAGLRVPDPHFSTTISAGRRLRPISCPVPAPGGQPDPSPRAGESRVGQLRWAHCPDDDGLHLLQPADVTLATTGSHAEALCGQPLPARMGGCRG